jgi:hypothetical protein
MQFSAKIFIIGINPYVFVPPIILKKIFSDAGKDKGYIPVALVINNKNFIQNLVKYSGKWRLYLNGPMRKIAKKDVGDTITIFIIHDPAERITSIHPKLKKALIKNKEAKKVFDSLPPSRKKEIARYINNLKTEKSVDKNITRAVNFLLGNERFIGRDKP